MKPHPLQVERELRGWSQAKIAEELGTTTRTVRRWEQGQAIPYPYYREQLCKLFGKNARELGFVPVQDGEDDFEPEPVPALIVEEPFVETRTQLPTLSPDQPRATLPDSPLLTEHEVLPAWPIAVRKQLRRFSRRQFILMALVASGAAVLTGTAFFNNFEMLLFPQNSPVEEKSPSGRFAVLPIPTTEGGWIYEAYYTGANRHMYELEQTNAQWFNVDVTAQALTPQLVALASPVSGVSLHNSPRVYYFGENDHIYELSRNRKKSSYWFNNDLNILSGGAPLSATPGALTSLIVPDSSTTSSEPHIYYCSQDQHIYELTWSGVEEWQYTDLTLAAAHAPRAAAQSALTSLYLQKDQSVRVYYMGTDKHICELIGQNGHWQFLDVTSAARATSDAAFDNSLACFVSAAGFPHVYYVGVDQHMYELSCSGADDWQCLDITLKAGPAPVVSSDSALVGFLALDASSAFVYYYGQNKHIYELSLVGQSWSHLDITIAAGNAPLAASTRMLAGFATQDDLLQMYYLAEDHHIYELLGGQMRGWQYQDITAAAL